MSQIDRIPSSLSLKYLDAKPVAEVTKSTQSFQQLLSQAIQDVNAKHVEAEQMTQKLMTGEIQDVHQVMIAAQKASLSLQLTVQVRNKVVEAYQEIMRMQV